MEFFDKKQDVINLQLTQYGRFLMSKGVFNPEYYAFYDDDIIYDYDAAGITEEQNATQERIKQTQRFETQVCYSPLEKDFNSSYNQIISGLSTAGDKSLLKEPEKNYILPQPLGTKKLNSEYSPAWSVRFLNGELTDATEYFEQKEGSGESTILMIPQVNAQIKVKTKVLSEADEIDFDGDTVIMGTHSIISEENELFVLLKIAEENGSFQKKNFDIEMFEVVESVENDVTLEYLRPLYFDPPPEETSDYNQQYPIPDTSFASYYFDVMFDEEIDDQILCTFDPVKEKMGVFADRRTEICQDVLEEDQDKVFNIYEDLDYPGEIC